MRKESAASGAVDRVAGKPPELEDWLNRAVFHPLAGRLAEALVPTRVSPNLVSVSGALCVVAATLAYTELDWPLSVAVDGADGALARLTGRASPAGELVDGICDYASHGILYVLMAAYLDDWIGWWAWPLATLAAFSRVAQSNHAESQRRIYLWRVYGIPWLQQAEASDVDSFARGNLAVRLAAPFARGYLALARAMSPNAAELDEMVAAASADPLERRRFSRRCRTVSRTALKLQIMLGANPRTLLLGLSMALGTPLWFFLAEATLLNLLLIVSVRHQNECNDRLGRSLRAARAP